MTLFTRESGTHSGHLPNDAKNKRTHGHDQRNLKRLVRKQGVGTKEDAKSARQTARWWE